MRVACLINQYPKVSHTFIRREILALERQGANVTRIALRGWDAEVVDEQDARERTRTTYVLEHRLLPLFGAVLRTAFARPKRFRDRPEGGTVDVAQVGAPTALPFDLSGARMLYPPVAGKAAHLRLHAHFGTNSAEVAMLVRLLGGPAYSFTVHGPDEIDDAKHLGFDRTIPAANFVAAISSYTRSQLQRHVDSRELGEDQAGPLRPRPPVPR